VKALHHTKTGHLLQFLGEKDGVEGSIIY